MDNDIASSPPLRCLNLGPNNVTHNSYPSLRSINSCRLVIIEDDIDAAVVVVVGYSSEEEVEEKDVEVGTVQ